MIQVTRTGTVFSGSAGDLDELGLQFDREHCVRLPQFFEPQLLKSIQEEIDKAEFVERVHANVFPPPVDLCMKVNKTALSLLFFLNDMFLFRLIEKITSCSRIGSFAGAVYRLVPGTHYYDSWHEDVDGNKLVAISINLSTGIYSGGVLQIRSAHSEKIIHEVANTGFGDAIVFRISPNLAHRVSRLEGIVVRTALAGAFSSQPDFNLRHPLESAPPAASQR